MYKLGYCQSLLLLHSCACVQLHRADSDGDGFVQAAEKPETEQRPRLLLPLPDPARPQVHSLSQRVAPRPQTLQPAHQHDLRPQGQPTHLIDFTHTWNRLYTLCVTVIFRTFGIDIGVCYMYFWQPEQDMSLSPWCIKNTFSSLRTLMCFSSSLYLNIGTRS